MKKGKIWWIYGNRNSGKTTLSNKLSSDKNMIMPELKELTKE